MSSRILRDSIKTSRTLDHVSSDPERMFYRLITVADDHGRFDADPRVLLAECFPLKVGHLAIDQVANWLNELVAVGLVKTYEVEDRMYGYFPSWFKHQRVRNTKSKFPPPEEGSPSQAAACGNLPQTAADSSKEPQAAAKGSNPPPDAALVIGNRALDIGNGLGTRRQRAAGKRQQVPEDFAFSEQVKALAKELGFEDMDILHEQAKFVDHHRGKGTLFKDLDAASRTWLRKAVEFAGATLNGAGGRNGKRQLPHTGFGSKDYRVGTW